MQHNKYISIELSPCKNATLMSTVSHFHLLLTATAMTILNVDLRAAGESDLTFSSSQPLITNLAFTYFFLSAKGFSVTTQHLDSVFWPLLCTPIFQFLLFCLYDIRLLVIAN